MSDLIAPPMSAAVLAGGQSRRMGSDKALLEIDGEPILARVIRTLTRMSDDVFVVGARSAYRQFGVPVIDDLYPEAGPLGGIASALSRSRYTHTLVVACDMPFLHEGLLRAMADERGDEDVLAPARIAQQTSSHGEPGFETLHAIYSIRCLDAITDRVQRGDLRIAAIENELRTRILDESWLRNVDPELISFTNTNDPGELALARERARKHQVLLKEDEMTQRDYSKFLREDGTLNVRMLPRPVYTQLVNAYRRQEHVFRQVFEEQFWLWDLEEAERVAAAEGRDMPAADLAQLVLDGMEDNDWWKCMSAFEKHFIDHFHLAPERWAEILDPVYDEQEEAGWVERQ